MAGSIAGSSDQEYGRPAARFDSGVTERIGFLSLGHWLPFSHSAGAVGPRRAAGVSRAATERCLG
jgi:hypothetical protein